MNFKFSFFIISLLYHGLSYAEPMFTEYAEPECAVCYEQQYQCYEQNGPHCTDDAIPCIQEACTHSKIDHP
jgi:hypothetical protein